MSCSWIILKLAPHPKSVEKLSSMKLVPGAKKVGDHYVRVICDVTTAKRLQLAKGSDDG